MPARSKIFLNVLSQLFLYHAFVSSFFFFFHHGQKVWYSCSRFFFRQYFWFVFPAGQYWLFVPFNRMFVLSFSANYISQDAVIILIMMAVWFKTMIIILIGNRLMCAFKRGLHVWISFYRRYQLMFCPGLLWPFKLWEWFQCNAAYEKIFVATKK